MVHPEYRADIDGLRAVAVLSVIGFHAFPAHVRAGFIGVDIFFVISGFLISTIVFSGLERDNFSFSEFYSRRLRRIFPALIAVLLFSLALGWFTLLPNDYHLLGKHVAGGAGFVSNFVLWEESGYFDKSAETKPLLHLWSLGIEEQFYIVWPLLLWLTWKGRQHFLVVVLAIAATSFGLSAFHYRNDVVANFYSPQTRFWELLIGAALAYANLHHRNLLHKPAAWLKARIPITGEAAPHNVLSVIGVLLITAGFIVVGPERPFPGFLALLPTLGAALIIAAGAQAWPNRTILSNRLLVYCGLISYPLYLWHWPLLSFARAIDGETPEPSIRIVAVLAAFLLAWMTYRFVERPVRFGKGGTATLAGLVALMAVTGFAGYECYRRDGFGFRTAGVAQKLLEFKYDYKTGYRSGSCFLGLDQNHARFESCFTPIEPGRTTLLLWGDSLAAHLYPGYRSRYGNTINLVQRTTSSCPPLIGIGHPICESINNHVLDEITRLKPDKVVLAANWIKHDWKKLEATIAQLRATGVKNIDLVGPPPQWRRGLPEQIYRFVKLDATRKIPDRMSDGLVDDFFRLDPIMAKFAGRLGINYISPASILCNSLGCLIKTGEADDTLVSWDDVHLTHSGSSYLVSRFPE